MPRRPQAVPSRFPMVRSSIPSRLTFGSLLILMVLGTGVAGRVQPAAAPPRPDWGPWLEDGAPFFSSVLDARTPGAPLTASNLSPRALVIPAGEGRWVAFDPDLLRVAAVWWGKGVTPTALAPGSYHQPDRKTPGGQKALPRPDGRVAIANGIYAGWQAGERPVLEDRRTPAP